MHFLTSELSPLTCQMGVLIPQSFSKHRIKQFFQVGLFHLRMRDSLTLALLGGAGGTTPRARWGVSDWELDPGNFPDGALQVWPGPRLNDAGARCHNRGRGSCSPSPAVALLPCCLSAQHLWLSTAVPKGEHTTLMPKASCRTPG